VFNYIIAGQGIAGSMLAWFLLKAGKKVLVFDEYRPGSSSNIAAGVTNPVTGRRLVKTWMADEILPFAKSTYTELEGVLGTTFYRPLKIVRVFDSVKAQNDWSTRCALSEYLPYLSNSCPVYLPNHCYNNPHGAFEIDGGSYLHTSVFLSAFRQYLKTRGMLGEERLEWSRVTITEKSVAYNGVVAEKLIFCEGEQATQNPWFGYLPFQPAKGECLLIESPELELHHMVKADIMLLPFYQPGLYYVGATHQNNYTHSNPSTEGREELLAGLNNLLKCPYKVVEHWAAVRPAVKGRRPLIGLHPNQPVLGIFNGMGTKGVSLAPYFANQFTRYLLTGTALVPEVDIQRFS